VGASLLAMASGQAHQYQLTHRFREQARSHSLRVTGRKIYIRREPLWERACSRWRQISHIDDG